MQIIFLTGLNSFGTVFVSGKKKKIIQHPPLSTCVMDVGVVGCVFLKKKLSIVFHHVQNSNFNPLTQFFKQV